MRYVIASLGDSVASGEGNPDRRADLSKAQWQDRRCHRSLRSGAALAAMAVERSSAGSSVALLALGCSGATMPVGLEAPYGGIKPGRDHAPRPATTSSMPWPSGRTSTRSCSASAPTTCPSRASSSSARASPTARTGTSIRVARSRRHRALADARGRDRRRAARLAARYDRLDGEIAAQIPRRRIIVSEYFDPTVGAGGTFCAIHLGPGRSTPARRSGRTPTWSAG